MIAQMLDYSVFQVRVGSVVVAVTFNVPTARCVTSYPVNVPMPTDDIVKRAAILRWRVAVVPLASV